MVTKEILENEFYSNAETAHILSVGAERVRQLCSGGRFEGAFKFGDTWLIPKEAVDNFKRKPRGFPKGTHKRGSKTQREINGWLKEAGYENVNKSSGTETEKETGTEAETK